MLAIIWASCLPTFGSIFVAVPSFLCSIAIECSANKLFIKSCCPFFLAVPSLLCSTATKYSANQLCTIFCCFDLVLFPAWQAFSDFVFLWIDCVNSCGDLPMGSFLFWVSSLISSAVGFSRVLTCGCLSSEVRENLSPFLLASGFNETGLVPIIPAELLSIINKFTFI